MGLEFIHLFHCHAHALELFDYVFERFLICTRQTGCDVIDCSLLLEKFLVSYISQMKLCRCRHDNRFGFDVHIFWDRIQSRCIHRRSLLLLGSRLFCAIVLCICLLAPFDASLFLLLLGGARRSSSSSSSSSSSVILLTVLR